MQVPYQPVVLRHAPVGDALATFDETNLRSCPIESITATEVTAPDIDVFNLTIDGPEANYFAEGILVHNKSMGQPMCPADMVTISPHADGDAAPSETQGDFDVSVKVAPDPHTFSVLFVREVLEVQPPPQSIEKTSDKVYRARLIDPAPRDYYLFVSGFLPMDGKTCRLPEIYRLFTVVPKTPGADASPGDAGSE